MRYTRLVHMWDETSNCTPVSVTKTEHQPFRTGRNALIRPLVDFGNDRLRHSHRTIFRSRQPMCGPTLLWHLGWCTRVQYVCFCSRPHFAGSAQGIVSHIRTTKGLGKCPRLCPCKGEEQVVHSICEIKGTEGNHTIPRTEQGWESL